MSNPLDAETIRNAADHVNTELRSRGYIEEPLLLNSSDWKQIFESQLEELTITDRIFANDKNIINIIHSLTQSMDRSRNTQKQANETIYKKDKTVNDLEEKLIDLQRKFARQSNEIQQMRKTEQQLNKEIQSLKRDNKVQSQEIIKSHKLILDLRNTHKVEMRKQELQKQQLRVNMLDKKKLSTVNTYGIDYIKNNSPVINNQEIDGTVTLNTQGNTTTSIVSQESEELIGELSSVIQTSSQQNYKYIKFIQILNAYFIKFSNCLNNKDQDIVELNPSNSLDVTIPDVGNEDYMNEIELFETVINPLIATIYQFYRNISGYARVNHDPVELEDLKHQLQVMTERWQEALKTSEEWKNFKLNGQ